MARVTGLEPATSGVTGRRSNQLSYTRALFSSVIVTVCGRLRCSSASVKRQEFSFFIKIVFFTKNAGKPRFLIFSVKKTNWMRSFSCVSENFCLKRAAVVTDQGNGGRLAQLVERLVYTEDVGSSSLSSPTTFFSFNDKVFEPLTIVSICALKRRRTGYPLVSDW